MKFEQALQAIREGKKVKRPNRFIPRTIKDGIIAEVYKDKDGKIRYEPSDCIYNCKKIGWWLQMSQFKPEVGDV